MNKISFLGLYIILGLLASCVSVVLALLKICKVITIPWLFVPLPFCSFIAFAIAAFIITTCIFDIRSRHNQRYITKNIY